ncbi:unnamed protein product, partial [Ectocarpus sp. 8 AP-2014]
MGTESAAGALPARGAAAGGASAWRGTPFKLTSAPTNLSPSHRRHRVSSARLRCLQPRQPQSPAAADVFPAGAPLVALIAAVCPAGAPAAPAVVPPAEEGGRGAIVRGATFTGGDSSALLADAAAAVLTNLAGRLPGCCVCIGVSPTIGRFPKAAPLLPQAAEVAVAGGHTDADTVAAAPPAPEETSSATLAAPPTTPRAIPNWIGTLSIRMGGGGGGPTPPTNARLVSVPTLISL